MHANLGSGSSHSPVIATDERGSFSPSFFFTILDLIYTKEQLDREIRVKIGHAETGRVSYRKDLSYRSFAATASATARLLIGYRWIERSHAIAAVEKFSRSDAPFSRYEFLKINSERGCAFDVEFLELAGRGPSSFFEL
ncbi:hypothetical protein OUZ56_009107 [Daphnia magna]|uniref:Uncharacterized protein n=1 Tax=Daphnia magna TaxID=35525 RepID=A0ABR0AF30_9CRUS|nr:hypothetical protein OUZ56_009107 [Daphnia magna]